MDGKPVFKNANFNLSKMYANCPYYLAPHRKSTLEGNGRYQFYALKATPELKIATLDAKWIAQVLNIHVSKQKRKKLLNASKEY